MRKQIFLKVLAHVFLLLILYVFQELVFTRLPVLGVVPVIIPISAVGVAIFGGPTWGAGYGAAAGLICDLAYRTLPAMAIILMAVGFFLGVLAETVMTKGLFSYIFCSIGILVLTAFIQMFSLLIFDGVSASSLLKIALYQTIYSLLFILPIYFPTVRISRKLRRTT